MLGIKVDKACLFVIFTTVFLSVVFWKSHFKRKMNPNIDWKAVNVTRYWLPETLNELSEKVSVTANRVGVQGLDIFYRKALPPDGSSASGVDVLLLHGKRFKSETWLNLKTIALLAAMGHSVIAVDLPGYGESSNQQVSTEKRGQFLKQLMSELNMPSAVVVSPSLSGSFTIPLLGTDADMFRGYVPVAPISTNELTQEQYSKITVPTLIMYGEKDKILGKESLENLKNIPTSKVFVLGDAGHPAYLDQPELFHQIMYNFLLLLYK